MTGDRLGLYLAHALWALLDFRSLSYNYGLVVYEGVLEVVEFWVDGRKRTRPVYEMERLLEVAAPEDIRPSCWRPWCDGRAGCESRGGRDAEGARLGGSLQVGTPQCRRLRTARTRGCSAGRPFFFLDPGGSNPWKKP